MKLDFNFKINDFRGNVIAQSAADVMILILEQGHNFDERYLSKIESWGKDLAKDGSVEMDLVDAKELKGIIIASRANVAINAIKSGLKNYMEKRITESTPVNGQEKKVKVK